MKMWWLAAALLMTAPALAQANGQPMMTPPPSQQQTDNQRAHEAQQPAAKTRKMVQPSKEQILQDTSALAASLRFGCEVSDADLINQGVATINGKDVKVRSYEIACRNGLGYFLIDPAPQPAFAFTCFSAEVIRATDLAAGRDPQPSCHLTASADLKQAASTVLSRIGQTCQATNWRQIGIDNKALTELTEVACSGGTGFVIASPIPGTKLPLSALSCPDSYRQNIPCRLSSNGAPIVTLDTFKQALVQHNVACTVENLRSIGRQGSSKRHVVEFKCPEQPNGLVAFIPLEDSTAPFETMDCPAAGLKAHVICTLTQIH